MMNLDFAKLDGLIPAVIQDHKSGRVLMVGFMNQEAFAKTLETGNVTFLQPFAQQALDERRKLRPLLIVRRSQPIATTIRC